MLGPRSNPCAESPPLRARARAAAPKTIREQIRRGLPMVDKRIDLIAYGAWLNLEAEKAKADGG